jgi:hypothetical protein
MERRKDMMKDTVVSITIGALTMHSNYFKGASLLEEIIGALAIAYMLMTCVFGYDFNFTGGEKP